MREFQAENDRHQTMIENNSVDSKLISNDQLTSSSSNKQQILSDQDANQSKINLITSESRAMGDRTKSNIKPVRLIFFFFKYLDRF